MHKHQHFLYQRLTSPQHASAEMSKTSPLRERGKGANHHRAQSVHPGQRPVPRPVAPSSTNLLGEATTRVIGEGRGGLPGRWRRALGR